MRAKRIHSQLRSAFAEDAQKWLLTRESRARDNDRDNNRERIHPDRAVRGKSISKSRSANRQFAAMTVGYSRRSSSPNFTLLTCSVSRGPRRRGACRSLRSGGDCCPTNWNWPSHRSYSRPAPGPEDGPSPEMYMRPSRSFGSTVSSQEFGSIAARCLGNRPLFIASRHRLCASALVIPARISSSTLSPSPSPASRRAAASR